MPRFDVYLTRKSTSSHVHTTSAEAPDADAAVASVKRELAGLYSWSRVEVVATPYDPLDDFNYVGSRHHY